MPSIRRPLASLGAVIVISGLCFAAKEFVMPEAKPANTYPAHDAHPTEHVSVALDPYDMPDKANIFSVPFSEEGFLPIFMVITNDSDQAVQLSEMKPQLVTVNREKLTPVAVDDIYRRLSHPSASATRSPIPIPRKKVKGVVSGKTLEEIQNARFGARAVEPHTSQAGFLFFDVTGIITPLAGAHFYLTGVRDANGNELMYFEIPLEKYLSAPPPAKKN